MKILICGATGFIGRNLIERLSAQDRPDDQIVAVWHERPPVDLPNIDWVQADLTRADDVDRVMVGVDLCIQAAATTSGAGDIVSRPYIHVADNAVMNSHIFRAAYDLSVGHVIFFSCTVMYPSSEFPTREQDFTGDIEPKYFGVGWTKVYLEKMAEFYAGLGRTRYTLARHTNIYGPHDKYDLQRSHFFGATVTKVMTATDDHIVVWGEGEEKRDLLHVDDLIDWVELAMARDGDPFVLHNVGYGQAFAVRDVVAMIIAASGRDLRMEHDLTKPTIPTSLYVDTSRVEAELGWRRQIDLGEGIRRTLEWYAGQGPGATPAGTTGL